MLCAVIERAGFYWLSHELYCTADRLQHIVVVRCAACLPSVPFIAPSAAHACVSSSSSFSDDARCFVIVIMLCVSACPSDERRTTHSLAIVSIARLHRRSDCRRNARTRFNAILYFEHYQNSKRTQARPTTLSIEIPNTYNYLAEWHTHIARTHPLNVCSMLSNARRYGCKSLASSQLEQNCQN